MTHEFCWNPPSSLPSQVVTCTLWFSSSDTIVRITFRLGYQLDSVIWLRNQFLIHIHVRVWKVNYYCSFSWMTVTTWPTYTGQEMAGTLLWCWHVTEIQEWTVTATCGFQEIMVIVLRIAPAPLGMDLGSSFLHWLTCFMLLQWATRRLVNMFFSQGYGSCLIRYSV